MSRVKVKKIKVPLGPNLKDENLAEIFNQMIGAGTVNLSIGYPRYVRMREYCEQIVKLFEVLNTSPFMRAYSEFDPKRKQIQAFCQNSRKEIGTLFAMDFSDYAWNLSLVEEPLQVEFSEKYLKMKKSDLINIFVIICDRLVPFRKNFTDLDKLNHNFILSMAGTEWCPFPFTNLNLKYIFSIPSIGKNTILFFMTILHRVFDLSYKIFEEIQSPDIDVDQFIAFIISTMEQVQKQPEISRCTRAFDAIKNSISLLKEKFNGYYRDFINTQDSMIMMQHFIIDVSNSTKADAETARQFRTIIKYYHKLANQHITSPQVRMLFEKVNATFRDLERGTENLANFYTDSNDKTDNTETNDEITDVTTTDSDPLCANNAITGRKLHKMYITYENTTGSQDKDDSAEPAE